MPANFCMAKLTHSFLNSLRREAKIPHQDCWMEESFNFVRSLVGLLLHNPIEIPTFVSYCHCHSTLSTHDDDYLLPHLPHLLKFIGRDGIVTIKRREEIGKNIDSLSQTTEQEMSEAKLLFSSLFYATAHKETKEEAVNFLRSLSLHFSLQLCSRLPPVLVTSF